MGPCLFLSRPRNRAIGEHKYKVIIRSRRGIAVSISAHYTAKVRRLNSPQFVWTLQTQLPSPLLPSGACRLVAGTWGGKRFRRRRARSLERRLSGTRDVGRPSADGVESGSGRRWQFQPRQGELAALRDLALAQHTGDTRLLSKLLRPEQ